MTIKTSTISKSDIVALSPRVKKLAAEGLTLPAHIAMMEGMGKASKHQDLYSGLIRLHILHHAAHEAVHGLGLIDELGRHGYKLSPGTLYPLLHRMEEKGYLASTTVRQGRGTRRVYSATARGKRALSEAKEKVRELFGELFEDDYPPAK